VTPSIITSEIETVNGLSWETTISRNRRDLRLLTVEQGVIPNWEMSRHYRMLLPELDSCDGPF
jgi:hypothetical protein